MLFAGEPPVMTLTGQTQLFHQRCGNTAAVPVNIIDDHTSAAGPFIQFMTVRKSLFLHGGKNILVCRNDFLFGMRTAVIPDPGFHSFHAVRHNSPGCHLTQIKAGGRKNHGVKQMHMRIGKRRKNMHSFQIDISVIALQSLFLCAACKNNPVFFYSQRRKGFLFFAHGMDCSAII